MSTFKNEKQFSRFKIASEKETVERRNLREIVFQKGIKGDGEMTVGDENASSSSWGGHKFSSLLPHLAAHS